MDRFLSPGWRHYNLEPSIHRGSRGWSGCRNPISRALPKANIRHAPKDRSEIGPYLDLGLNIHVRPYLEPTVSTYLRPIDQCPSVKISG